MLFFFLVRVFLISAFRSTNALENCIASRANINFDRGATRRVDDELYIRELQSARELQLQIHHTYIQIVAATVLLFQCRQTPSCSGFFTDQKAWRYICCSNERKLFFHTIAAFFFFFFIALFFPFTWRVASRNEVRATIFQASFFRIQCSWRRSDKGATFLSVR